MIILNCNLQFEKNLFKKFSVFTTFSNLYITIQQKSYIKLSDVVSSLISTKNGYSYTKIPENPETGRCSSFLYFYPEIAHYTKYQPISLIQSTST